ELTQRLGKLRQPFLAEQPAPAFFRRDARQLGLNTLAHEAWHVLKHGGRNAGAYQQRHQACQQLGDFEEYLAVEQYRIMLGGQRPALRALEKHRQKTAKLDRAGVRYEDEENQNRREGSDDGHLLGEGQLSL